MNAKRLLRFLIAAVDTLPNAVLVPATAVQSGGDGRFIWVLDDSDRVSRHAIVTGIQYDQQLVVSSGLNTGERVVTDGIDLTDGAQVTVSASAKKS